MRILNYLDDWLILAQSQDTLISHIDSLHIHFGVPRAMCQHAEEHSCPESVHNISGTMFRLRGDESPPLARVCGGHFVFPAPFQTKQLCSVEEFSEAARTHGSGFSGVSPGLITHAPLQLWLKSRVPWTAWTSGCLSIAVTRGCIEALTPWCNPDLFSR